MCVNTYSFVFDTVPDQFKFQEMCDKAVDDNTNELEFVHNRYKTQEICIKAVDDYANTLEFAPDRYKT